ncbi:MAG: hypothetical protein RR290_03720, partial [Clostridia bacterium]
YTLMFRKSIKGYYFNIAFLLIETLYIVLNINVNISEYFSMFFIFFMIWFLPNYIYFKKRLYLFCNNSKNNENLEEIIDKKHINTSDTVYPLKIVIPYMIIFAILLIGGLLFYFIINEKDTKISNIESNIVQLENSLKNIKIDKQNLNNELSILF